VAVEEAGHGAVVVAVWASGASSCIACAGEGLARRHEVVRRPRVSARASDKSALGWMRVRSHRFLHNSCSGV
jgi:hypothetical protein